MGFKIAQASAGTGKTTSLIEEVFDFYFKFKNSQNREPRVILTTFTRKATAELRERIVKKAISSSNNDFLKFTLSKQIYTYLPFWCVEFIFKKIWIYFRS